MGTLKILIVGAIMWQSIPISVRIGDMIEATYGEPVTSAIESAKQMSEHADEIDVTEETVSTNSSTAAPSSLVDSISQTISGWGSATTEFVENTVGSITNKAEAVIAWAKLELTQVTEGFAVMVVTSCIIPIAVPLVMVWMVKLFFQPSAISETPLLLPRPPRERSTRRTRH